jgi:integrase
MEGSLTRQGINQRVGRIKRMLKWAAAEEMLPVTIYQALATVDGLRKDRRDARESEGVRPVADQIVQQSLPHLSETVAAMVRFQRKTGCRPGEVCTIRPRDADALGKVWVYDCCC